MKKVFLTGADGLLGSNLCHELTARGYHVVAFIEKGKNAMTIKHLPNLTIKEGDILDAENLTRHMTGSDYVIHAAANTTLNPARLPIIVKVNVDGTKNVLQAAEKIQPKKIIVVGSANSFSPGSKENPGREGTPYTCHIYNTDYMDSKYQAYLEAMDAFENRGMPVLSVHPTFMLGPFDSKPSSGALIMAVYRRKTLAAAKGGKNYVHVKDVANAIVNALEIGRPGENYILGNENLTYREMFDLVSREVNVPKPKFVLPRSLILAYGLASNFFQMATKKPVAVNYTMCRISCDDHYYTAQKAVNEIGLQQTPIDNAIHESFKWMKSHFRI